MEYKNNILVPQPYIPTKEEELEMQWKKKYKELKIGRLRASVVRSQVVEVYKILENIKLDYISDTMFRDYFTTAKRSMEAALSDFLLSDNYWEKALNKHKKLNYEEYDESLSKGIVKNSPISDTK